MVCKTIPFWAIRALRLPNRAHPLLLKRPRSRSSSSWRRVCTKSVSSPMHPHFYPLAVGPRNGMGAALRGLPGLRAFSSNSSSCVSTRPHPTVSSRRQTGTSTFPLSNSTATLWRSRWFQKPPQHRTPPVCRVLRQQSLQPGWSFPLSVVPHLPDSGRLWCAILLCLLVGESSADIGVSATSRTAAISLRSAPDRWESCRSYRPASLSPAQTGFVSLSPLLVWGQRAGESQRPVVRERLRCVPPCVPL